MAAYDIVTWSPSTASTKRVPSSTSQFDFSSVRIGADNLLINQTGAGGGAAFNFNTRKLSNVVAGAASTDGVNKGQMDAAISLAVLTGGSLKEAILVADQLSTTQGIRAATAYFATSVASNAQTFVLDDGVTTETWTYAAVSGAFAPATGATAVDSMQNLAAKISAESTIWDARFIVDDLDSINAAGVVVIWEKLTAAGLSPSRISGTAAGGNYVAYYLETEYKTVTGPVGISGTPTEAFGFRRELAALVNGEIHYIHEIDAMEAWNQDGTIWVTFQNGAIPDATSASGGGVKGKVTADSDFGLSITAGVLKIVTDAGGAMTFSAGSLAILLQGSTLSQSALGLKVAAAGITETELNTSVAGNGITGGGGSALAVGAGDGIKVGSNDVAVDYTKSLVNNDAGTITVRQVVWVRTDGQVGLADANTSGLGVLKIGVVYDATIATTAAGLITVRDGAVIPGYTGLTIGKKVYIGKGTPGAYTQDISTYTTGDHVYRVGYAVSATEVEFSPEYEIEL